jgi:hypothetical protein
LWHAVWGDAKDSPTYKPSWWQRLARLLRF